MNRHLIPIQLDAVVTHLAELREVADEFAIIFSQYITLPN
jgi:hypothetical protein